MHHPNPLLTGDRLFLSCYWLSFLVIKMVMSLILTVSVNLKGRPTPFATQTSPPRLQSHVQMFLCLLSLKGHRGGDGKVIFPVALCVSTLSCGLRTQA